MDFLSDFTWLQFGIGMAAANVLFGAFIFFRFSSVKEVQEKIRPNRQPESAD